MNLSQEVLAGQQKRATKGSAGATMLEAQVVDAADSIAYNAHDVDDALKLELVDVDQLRDVPLVAAAGTASATARAIWTAAACAKNWSAS